jgi:glycosyltransferase involved in cell wall biosynthesis
MSPLFSVVIPTLNRKALLQRALETVFHQDHAGAEIIVVDDGSTDGSLEYLASLEPRIRVIRLDRRGPGAARNAGAALASGEYLAFLDSDDLWFPWTLAAFGQIIERYDRPSYICGRFVQFSDERALADSPSQSVKADAYPDYLSSWPRQLVIGAGMVAIKREVFEAVGGFAAEPVNLEDHDLSLKLGVSKGFVQIQQPVTMAWRLHAGGVTNDLSRSLAGCRALIDHERAGVYPGGAVRAGVRRGIITTHTRSLSLECVKVGKVKDACAVYLSTLQWHLSLGRWKYLLVFPLWVVTAPFRRSQA